MFRRGTWQIRKSSPNIVNATVNLLDGHASSAVFLRMSKKIKEVTGEARHQVVVPDPMPTSFKADATLQHTRT